MTFDQVLVFHRIVQSGSFKQAAAELHKTQPAISLTIKKLEDELEVNLFDRSGHRPSLTSHGRSFFEKSLKVLQGMSELEGLSQSFQKNEEPEIFISIDGISPLPRLLHVFKHFSDRYSNTKLNLSLDILSEAERRVLSKEAQFGITHFHSEKHSFEVVTFTSVRMIRVISGELYKDKKLRSQRDLLDIDQIVIGDKNGPKGTSFGLLEGGKKWRISDSHFKRDIIFAGLGWGHLAEHTIERELEESKLVVLDFEDIHPKELPIYLIRLKRHQTGLVAAKLWEELLLFSKKAIVK
jgi:DNA-binding transcriptional LysR family regulator